MANTKSETKNPETIDLIAIADKLKGSEKVRQSCKNGSDVAITAKQLSKKYPSLSALNNTILIRFFKLKNDDIGYFMPALFEQDGNITVAIPDKYCETTDLLTLATCSIVEKDGEIDSVNTYCLLKVSEEIADNTLLKVNLRLNDEGRKAWLHKGETELKAEHLNKKPCPETPLRDLPVGSKWEIIKKSGESQQYSQQYKTPLIDIKGTDGEVIKYVLTNSSLSYHVANGAYGFKIVSISERTNKDDKTIHNVEIDPFYKGLEDLESILD